MLLSPPPLTQIAQDALAMAEPIAVGDDQRGFPLTILFGAIGEMFRQVEEAVRARATDRQPWQQAFDITAAPSWLYPWLGQVVGVQVNVADPPAAQQAQIMAEANFQRGTVQALASSIAATLWGSQTVAVLERTSSAWTVEAVTNPSETPDVTATLQAALRAKVAGLVLTLIQSSVPIIDQGARTIDSATATVDSAAITDIN